MKKTLRIETFLAEMNTVIPWKRLLTRLTPHYPKRTQFKAETLLRIYFLQQWYALSDPAMEEALYDRMSFQQFIGLDGFTDLVPDESTILRFRHFLETHDLAHVLLCEVNQYLGEKGLIVKSGTIVDATVIEAPVSKKNTRGERDPEMSSTKKNNRWYFGAKGHIGIQSKGLPLIHSTVFTTAKSHDGQHLETLLHGDEQAIFGDAAYASKARKQLYRKKGVHYGISEKRAYQHPLSEKQKKRNRRHCPIRAHVEHPFRIIKVLWGQVKCRYRGLKKNASQFTILCGLSNLFFSRKHLLAQAV